MFERGKTFLEQYLPEYKEVLKQSGGQKPRKFTEKVEVRVTPAVFNPSAQGDYALTQSFDWDGEALNPGPSYSYDTMMSTVESPYERIVDVPTGHRIWITTYDGQWGGYWSRVLVFVSENDPVAKFAKRALKEGRVSNV